MVPAAVPNWSFSEAVNCWVPPEAIDGKLSKLSDLWAAGVMVPTAIKTAGKVGYPRDKVIGIHWSGSEEDVIPADTTPPPNFPGPGSDSRFFGTNNPPGALGDYAGNVGSCFGWPYAPASVDWSGIKANGAFAQGNLMSDGSFTSNTAFRTFGNIQPYVIREDAIEHVAHQLSQTLGRRVLPEEIRRRAYELYEQRGRRGGSPEEDWSRAETEILSKSRREKSA